MNLTNSSKMIFTNRFILRLLNVDDVTDRYLGWLKDETTSKFISSTNLNINELREYVLERLNRDDVLFFGIFERITGLHIGNVKYEPVNSKLRYATVGILIGEADWRGKGVVTEVLSESTIWLHQYHNIEQIVLGVSFANLAAIQAYKKAGFIEQTSMHIQNDSPENMTMVLELKNNSCICDNSL